MWMTVAQILCKSEEAPQVWSKWITPRTDCVISPFKVVGQERKTPEHAQIPGFLTLLLRGLVSGETYVTLPPYVSTRNRHVSVSLAWFVRKSPASARLPCRAILQKTSVELELRGSRLSSGLTSVYEVLHIPIPPCFRFAKRQRFCHDAN